jgi:hypothetical protein
MSVKVQSSQIVTELLSKRRPLDSSLDTLNQDLLLDTSSIHQTEKNDRDPMVTFDLFSDMEILLEQDTPSLMNASSYVS